ncbi:MAG: flagellar M-ring protein FliF C-terminal domain-containing protein, partial [Yersiniaceae bacterium]|nr:flagellar M-ring protein FliF C-terminal domain-containing protein [Yersiniaceae bacterium]
LTDAQLKQINDLVREAMGYSAERGDSLNVVNTPFNDTQDLPAELPFWKQQSFFEQLLNAGRYLLILIVAWILWRKLVRPQLRKQQQAQEAAVAAAAAAQATSAAESAPTAKPSSDELAQRKRSQQRVSVEVQTQRVQELADKEPRVVALVIRQWMSTEL